MRISVFGLGYVGCVSAACFAKEQHEVIGVDVSANKVDLINRGASPIVEAGIDTLIADQVASGRLRATRDTRDAIQNSEISLVCVGTPSRPNGSLDLCFIQRVCEEIGEALKAKAGVHTVIIRSTMLPGSMEQVVIPALEQASGRTLGSGLSVCINPEFLREGTALKDFYAPPFTLIGADDSATAQQVLGLYEGVHAPIQVISMRAAEMVKYTCNCFHALKVGFANEVGNLCKSLNIDSHEVMDVFCQDTKLNLSPYYLKPGFAFGGSCLPKDLRAINYKAREIDVEVPILSSILGSNRLQVQRAIDMTLATGRKRIGILGLAFKSGTDDLRESPMVTLTETLMGKGMQVTIYDNNVSLARIEGANKRYIECEIPHIADLMRGTIAEIIESSEVLIIGNNSPEFAALTDLVRPGQTVLDLARAFPHGISQADYQGICW